MAALLTNVEFWKSLSAILWPVVALIVFFNLRKKLISFFNRENISIKVAGFEISVADVTKRIGEDVTDLQKRLAEMETRFSKERVKNPQENPSGNTESNLSPELENNQSTKQFRILWADDYPSNNAFLLEQFQADGIEVLLALTTEEALNAFRSDQFDLVITDLGRRENGVSQPYAGLALIKEIRKHDTEIPILVYAGHRGAENLVRLKKAGANFVSQSAVELQGVVLYYRQPKPDKPKPLTS